MKITIKGQPGQFVEKGNVIITLMKQETAPTLPRDLPNPGNGPTNYLIYISRKQWNKIKDAVAEKPDDMVIVEGQPLFDKELGVLSVFTSRITTQTLETARREEQRRQRQAEAEAEAEAEANTTT